MHQSDGFSLLEVIVVVFLVALFSTVAVLRLGVGQGVLIESEARQFADRLNLLMDESLLSGRVYRIVFDVDDQTYEYQQFNTEWTVLTDKPYNRKVMANNMAFALEVTAEVDVDVGEESAEPVGNNVVVVNTDGVTTLFQLRFGERNQDNAVDDSERVWLVQGGQSVTVSDVDAG